MMIEADTLLRAKGKQPRVSFHFGEAPRLGQRCSLTSIQHLHPADDG